MSNYPIITATDDNYVIPVIVMLGTAKKKSSFEISVVIGFVEGDLSISNQVLLRRTLEAMEILVSFIKIPVNNLMRASQHISRTAFARLYMIEKLDATVIWLDADVLCFELWDQLFLFAKKTNRKVIGAVRDPVVSNPNFQNSKNNRAAVAMKSNYFNSGVMIINCDAWNKLKFKEFWKIIAEKYEEYQFDFLDQCILNYVCHQNFFLIPDEFNVLAFLPHHSLDQKTRILHFAGPAKPWDYPRISLKRYFSKLKSSDIKLYYRCKREIFESIKMVDRETYMLLREVSTQQTKAKNLKEVIIERIKLEKNLSFLN
jgi:lipopolysaccharide biosynthesis glycosyltransferase